MIIVKKLEWMRDYISSVEHLLPHLKQLKKISSKTGNKERWQHSHGLISYYNNKTFRITLYITYHDMISDKIKDYTTIDLLKYLAHELAHLHHWEHTPDHTMLEATLTIAFMSKLKAAGYISEEDEEKNGSFY